MKEQEVFLEQLVDQGQKEALVGLEVIVMMESMEVVEYSLFQSKRLKSYCLCQHVFQD